MNIKESEKTDKYLDLARELKKLWNMKVMVLPIAVETFWNSSKEPDKEIESNSRSQKESTLSTLPQYCYNQQEYSEKSW